MRPQLSVIHLSHLVDELRQAAIDGQAEAQSRDDGGYGLCMEAGLANDAADAIATLIVELSDRLDQAA